MNNFLKEMGLLDAEKLALSCLKQVMEEKINKDNVELVTIPVATRLYTVRDPAYVQQILANLK